jgi:hypothetical protein
MNLDDMTPAGGGSLRAPATPGPGDGRDVHAHRGHAPGRDMEPARLRACPPQRPLPTRTDVNEVGTRRARAHGETSLVGSVVHHIARDVRAALRASSGRRP